MGRQFEKRKTTMFKRWDRMAREFGRLAKEIAIAVKAGGGSPDSNGTLRRVIQNARAANMPKDKIEGAIKRATGVDAVDYDEVLYEGYGPHGVAFMVETATDNGTRTVANLRMIFNKGGGNLGNTGCVAFQFQRMGVFRLSAEGIDADELELELIDEGLEELLEGESDDGEAQYIIRCAFGDLAALQTALETRGITPASAGAEYVCQAPMELEGEQEEAVLQLIAALEEDDDVQRVSTSLG